MPTMNRLHAALCALSIACAAPGHAEGVPDGHRYIAERAGLANCRLRFLREGKGRVAFLGGSITNMEGWRALVCQMLEDRFPDMTFDFINAGIPSTDSTFGAFRLEDDAFAQGPVDLLFVEFAVNDEANGRMSVERIRGMEGIIRRARRCNPAVDIVMLQFVDPEKMDAINAGRVPPVIADHERVALHYAVPSIDLAREVTERIAAGEFDWDTFGGLHPAPFGHEVYAASINRLFDRAWATVPASDAAIVAHVVPKDPLDPRHYGNGRLVGPDRANLGDGWRLDPSWSANDAATRPRFAGVPVAVATEPGAVLTFPFTGSAVGIVVVAGPDIGIIEFRVDETPWRQLDQFTQWSPRLHIPWAYMLDADLEAGAHELVLRTTGHSNEAGRGHACRIVKFLVQ